MSAGDQIAAEIAAAFAEGSASVGNGPLRVTVVRKGAKSGPAYEPTYTPPTQVNVAALYDKFTMQEMASDLYQMTDIKITLAARQGIVPTNADELVIDGKTHQIKRVDPFRAGGVDLYYDLWVKA